MVKTEKNLISLQNNRLTVEIALPGTVYQGARFDWNGFITGITFDNLHTFCVCESPEPKQGTGGVGLCGEFGIDQAIGYDEAEVGDYFTKIGVGLLKKLDVEPYNFFRSYECIPQSSSTAFGTNSVTFTAKAESHNGYAYVYHKSILLCENKLKLAYSLENTGNKGIHTTEYCHNFLGIDGEKVDSGGYILRLPLGGGVKIVQGDVYHNDGTITWPDAPMRQQFYCLLDSCKDEQGCSWSLSNVKAGAGISESHSFTACKFALWGFRHVISPETFVQIDVAPGLVQEWNREYEFFYL